MGRITTTGALILIIPAILFPGCIDIVEDENRSPEASIFVERTYYGVDEEILFDGSGSNDPDGEIVEYRWDFGDGESSNKVYPTHSYDNEGIYTVKLTVRDNNNSRGHAEVEMIIVDGTSINGPGSISLTTTDGGTIRFKDHRGKKIILDMFATWCQPCKTQVSEIAEMKTTYDLSDVVIISAGVDPSETLSQLKDYKDENGADWTFIGYNQELCQHFPASAIPTIYILDEQGEEKFTHVGVIGSEELYNSL